MIPMKRTIAQMIYEFQKEIIREYNMMDGIETIYLSTELFNQHVIELSQDINLSPSDISRLSVMGINIRAGNK